MSHDHPERGGPNATPPDRAPDALAPDDARFVARVAEAWAPPAPTPTDRARFQAGLEARLARRARPRLWPWLVPAAVALAAVLLLTTRELGDETRPGSPAIAVTPTDDAPSVSEEETLLALVDGDVASDDESLPEDYQAIASLMY